MPLGRLRLAVLCLLLLLPIPVRAEEAVSAGRGSAAEDKQYFQHTRDAAQLYTAGKYVESLTALNQAYKVRKAPSILLNIAHVYSKLNRPAEAIDFYQRYRAAAPSLTPKEIAELEKYIAAAKKQAAPSDVVPMLAVVPAPPVSAPPAVAQPPIPTNSPPADGPSRWTRGRVAAVTVLGVLSVVSIGTGAGLYAMDGQNSPGFCEPTDSRFPLNPNLCRYNTRGLAIAGLTVGAALSVGTLLLAVVPFGRTIRKTVSAPIANRPM